MIRKKGKKWVLFTSNGDRILGMHDSYDKALAQERAIHVHKKVKYRMNSYEEDSESYSSNEKHVLSGIGLTLTRPIPIYHASLNVQGILESGFKTRKELGVSGAGGGPRDAISFSGDTRVTAAVCVALGTIIRLVTRNLSAEHLFREMEFVCAESFNDMVKKKIHLFNGDFNSDRAIDDVVALYQDFYMAAQMRRSAYDPYLASNINDQFRGKSIDILKGVGVIKTFIPEGAIIVPNHTTFQMWHKYKQKYPFYENSYVDFSIKMIRSNRSIVVYTDLLSDEIKEYVQAASPYVPGNIASLSFEDLPLFEEMNSMNEYRCYNTDFLRRQSLSIETYLLEIYEDVLPRLWGRDDIKSFYPYFKDQDLTTNLVTPQN